MAEYTDKTTIADRIIRIDEDYLYSTVEIANEANEFLCYGRFKKYQGGILEIHPVRDNRLRILPFDSFAKVSMYGKPGYKAYGGEVRISNSDFLRIYITQVLADSNKRNSVRVRVKSISEIQLLDSKKLEGVPIATSFVPDFSAIMADVSLGGLAFFHNKQAMIEGKNCIVHFKIDNEAFYFGGTLVHIAKVGTSYKYGVRFESNDRPSLERLAVILFKKQQDMLGVNK